jgi:hypothetical protein
LLVEGGGPMYTSRVFLFSFSHRIAGASGINVLSTTKTVNIKDKRQITKDKRQRQKTKHKTQIKKDKRQTTKDK